MSELNVSCVSESILDMVARPAPSVILTWSLTVTVATNLALLSINLFAEDDVVVPDVF